MQLQIPPEIWPFLSETAGRLRHSYFTLSYSLECPCLCGSRPPRISFSTQRKHLDHIIYQLMAWCLG